MYQIDDVEFNYFLELLQQYGTTNHDFYQSLYEEDARIAQQTRESGCSCGGALHQSNYPRKARGIHPEYDHFFQFRFSFCCDQQGCRKRKTPFSVRFLGRKVYIAVFFIVLCLCPVLAKPLVLCLQTLRRWQLFWSDTFVRSVFWQNNKAVLAVVFDEQSLPFSLFNVFLGSLSQRLFSLLKFLRPLTTAKNKARNLMPLVAPQKMLSG